MRNVSIIEDNRFLLTGYKQFLDNFSDLSVDAAVTSLEEFLAGSGKKASELDFLIADINVPGFGGVDGIAHLHHLLPFTKILVLTNETNNDCIVNAFKNGACGYITKDEKLNSIYQAIKDIEVYGAYISPTAAKALALSFRSNNPVNTYDALLTRREKELVNLVIKGMSYKEMAQYLNISHFTVNHHLKKMYLKLNVRSKTELVYKMTGGMDNSPNKSTRINNYRLQIA